LLRPHCRHPSWRSRRYEPRRTPGLARTPHRTLHLVCLPSLCREAIQQRTTPPPPPPPPQPPPPTTAKPEFSASCVAPACVVRCALACKNVDGNTRCVLHKMTCLASQLGARVCTTNPRTKHKPSQPHAFQHLHFEAESCSHLRFRHQGIAAVTHSSTCSSISLVGWLVGSGQVHPRHKTVLPFAETLVQNYVLLCQALKVGLGAPGARTRRPCQMYEYIAGVTQCNRSCAHVGCTIGRCVPGVRTLAEFG
jgi:hypothetical protein